MKSKPKPINTTQKLPIHFWIVGILALLWNLMGCVAYLGQRFMTEDMLAAMPEAEQEIFLNTPAWATAAFAIAVWGGLVGSIMLLIKKSGAGLIFIISFMGVLTQFSYNFLLANSIEIYGPGGLIMPIMVIVLAAFFIYYARMAKAKGWIG